MGDQGRPSGTITGLRGEEVIIGLPFPIEGLLEGGQVSPVGLIKGEAIKGAVIAFDLRLASGGVRSNEAMADTEAESVPAWPVRGNSSDRALRLRDGVAG